MDDGLRARVRAWIDDDPDAGTQAELTALLDAGADGELADRFAGVLEFGTAGLRGPLRAGPNGMNRAVVRRAAAGLVGYLEGTEGPVVIGFDARHGSRDFAEDTARVVAGAGRRALLLPRPLPTPVLAFSIRHLGAVAGVMVTASHNPPQDNGYKVYLGDGAQIVPPADSEIAAHIAGVASVRALPLADLDDPLVTRLDDAPLAAYLAAVTALPDGPRDLQTVYTPLHGVGRDTALAAVERAGFPAPHVVAAQGDPDPDFPTLPFPNPEEPGALDLALADARRLGVDLVLANDPDADRLGIAVPDTAREGGWRPLRGDEIGALLASHVLATTSGDDRLVVTTIVSSTLLGRIAAAAGVRYAETLTGFKWIVRGSSGRAGDRFVFGYEEALGFSVGTAVRDKDGISALLAVCALAAQEKARGRSLLDVLDDLTRAHGVHATDQWPVTLRGAEGKARIAEVMGVLRAEPPTSLAGQPVSRVRDLVDGEGELPPSDVVVLELGAAGRVVVRPSGTEPKLKAYFEAVVPVTGTLAAARAEAAERLAAMRRDLAAATGL